MPEQPAPEPEKAKSDAASKAASHFAPSGGGRASAYVPLPGRPAKSRLGLALAALAAAGALAGGVMWMRAPTAPVAAPIAAAQQKILWVSDKDVNVAATEALRRGAPAVPAAGTMGSGESRPVPVKAEVPEAMPVVAQAPAIQTESRASSPLPVVPPELKSLPASAPQAVLTPRGAAAVKNDGWQVFQMRMIDNVDQDGDVVQISVDGVPVSFLSLTHAGATLEIPLKKGESHVITVTAVKDGVGGITFGMSTSVGDLVSRRMAVGESESWQVGFK